MLGFLPGSFPYKIVIYELIYAIMLISRSSKSNLSSCRVYNPGCPPLSELGRWTLTRFYFLLRPFPTYTCFFTASPCRFLYFEHFLTSFYATPTHNFLIVSFQLTWFFTASCTFLFLVIFLFFEHGYS